MNYPWFKPLNNFKVNKKNLNIKLESKKLTFGQGCLKLEKRLKRLLKVKHIILTTSGTSALMMAYLAISKSSDKVLASDTNWVASLNPAKILNLKICLVDSTKNSFQTNFYLLNKKIKKIKPNLVLLTHLNGDPNYNKEFNGLRKKLKFKVIEDAAQSFMVKYNQNRFTGTLSDVGCFSLGVTKLTHMVYGGFCATNSNAIAKKLISIRNNGLNSLPDNMYLQASSCIGLNFKPSDLHASVGIKNLQKIKLSIRRVNKVYNVYSKYLTNDKLKHLSKKSKFSIPLYNYLQVRDKLKFIKFCEKKGIGVHTGFRAIHENKPFYKSYKKFKNSTFMSKYFIRIPSGPGYKTNEIKKICRILNNYSH